MKRILILVIPLALLVGFLSIKPPAIGADAKPITVSTPGVVQTPKPSDLAQPLSPTSPKTSKKPSISGGGNDDDDRVKPKYGGHDDDDYDD